MNIQESMQFDLGLISKHRTSLMGIATLMIIVCHILEYDVDHPPIIDKILWRGNYGVDIFLFLSGLGCWYSLSKGSLFSAWYRKRFVRIFVPYLFMQIPFWSWRIAIGTFYLPHELLVFSTLDFWLHHVGAWYVALLLPLYFITPPIYNFLKSGNAVFRATLLIVALIVTCSLDISMLDGSIHEILRNMQGAFGRVPSFIIGMAIAPLVKCGTKVNVWWLTLLPLIIYVLVHALMGGNMPEAWSLVLPIVVLLTVVLEKVSTTGLAYRFATWMGVISLESYLANIYLPSVVRYTLMPLRTDLPIFTG